MTQQHWGERKWCEGQNNKPPTAHIVPPLSILSNSQLTCMTVIRQSLLFSLYQLDGITPPYDRLTCGEEKEEAGEESHGRGGVHWSTGTGQLGRRTSSGSGGTTSSGASKESEGWSVLVVCQGDQLNALRYYYSNISLPRVTTRYFTNTSTDIRAQTQLLSKESSSVFLPVTLCQGEQQNLYCASLCSHLSLLAFGVLLVLYYVGLLYIRKLIGLNLY